jgi:hypothetical protein
LSSNEEYPTADAPLRHRVAGAAGLVLKAGSAGRALTGYVRANCASYTEETATKQSRRQPAQVCMVRLGVWPAGKAGAGSGVKMELPGTFI